MNAPTIVAPLIRVSSWQSATWDEYLHHVDRLDAEERMDNDNGNAALWFAEQIQNLPEID